MEPANKNVALDILLFLMKKAAAREVTTYHEITEQVLSGETPTNVNGMMISKALTEIHHWCLKGKMPYFNSLAVRKSGGNLGLPGSGFWNLLQFTCREARSMWTEGPLNDAPREVRETILRAQQLKAFEYMRPLSLAVDIVKKPASDK